MTWHVKILTKNFLHMCIWYDMWKFWHPTYTGDNPHRHPVVYCWYVRSEKFHKICVLYDTYENFDTLHRWWNTLPRCMRHTWGKPKKNAHMDTQHSNMHEETGKHEVLSSWQKFAHINAECITNIHIYVNICMRTCTSEQKHRFGCTKNHEPPI